MKRPYFFPALLLLTAILASILGACTPSPSTAATSDSGIVYYDIFIEMDPA